MYWYTCICARICIVAFVPFRNRAWVADKMPLKGFLGFGTCWKSIGGLFWASWRTLWAFWGGCWGPWGTGCLLRGLLAVSGAIIG